MGERRKSTKRPCRICGKWFTPHPRLGTRQKTCGKESGKGVKSAVDSCRFPESRLRVKGRLDPPLYCLFVLRSPLNNCIIVRVDKLALLNT